jgi:hypothetical protein
MNVVEKKKFAIAKAIDTFIENNRLGIQEGSICRYCEYLKSDAFAEPCKGCLEETTGDGHTDNPKFRLGGAIVDSVVGKMRATGGDDE